jgi:hypothetical protein
MKILTENEQLQKKSKELWDTMKFQEREVEEKQRAYSRLTDQGVHNKGKARVIKYEIEEMKKVRDAVSEYYDHVSELLKASRQATEAKPLL